MRSGSHSLNAALLTPSASAPANHSRMRAYSRAAVGRSSGWRAARSHSSTHSMKSSCSAPGAGRHWSIIAASRSVRWRRLVGAADAHVAGALVGVLERLGQQRVARVEVVVDAAADTPASIAMRAIRTSSMPSLAIRRTAASRMRSRALARPRALGLMTDHVGRRAAHPRAGRAPGPRPGVRRRDPDPAARRRPSAPAAARRRGRRADQARGARRAALRRAAPRASTAARAGRTSSGSWSRSSSGARPTRCPGTSRPPTTCSRTAPPEQIERWLQPGAARRAARRLRGHRGARGLRPVGHRDHRDARPTPAGASTARSGSSPTATSPPSTSSWQRAGRRRSLPTLFLIDRGAPGHRGRRRPAVHPHLSARPPDAALRAASRSATTR